MHWFDQEFASGDVNQEAVIADYLAHLASLGARSGASVQELIHTNLHDGRVRAWALEGDTFTWSMAIGDLKAGYALVSITYRDATLIGATAAELVDFDLFHPEHELVSDEIDHALDESGGFEQRFRIWPDLVFAVRFRDVDVARRSVEGRHA